MRILHTSDWHIGRTFHGSSTLRALQTVLDELVDQVRTRSVDVVVIAGDIFDSAAPAAACYPLLTNTLAQIHDAGAQVLATSGNHDSPSRLGFQAALLQDGIHILTDPDNVATPVVIHDRFGPVCFYGIPYLEPALIRHSWPGVRSQHEALTHAMGLIRKDMDSRGGRAVVAAHCFTAGVEPVAHLERDIQQGGLDVVPLNVFDGPDYVALGHIHGRATLTDRIRYSGAPLHYSFGEKDKPRGAWQIDLDSGGLSGVQWVDLPIPRRLEIIRGSLEDLLTDPGYAGAENAWVSARYTDPTMQPDPMRRLQGRFPYCAEVRHEPDATPEDDTRTFTARVAAAAGDEVGLVDMFLAHVRSGHGATGPETQMVRAVIDARRATEASA